MAKAGLLFLFLLFAQDEFPPLLELLSHDNPATRDEAAEKLVQGYAAWRPRLEERLSKPLDADLRARIQGVLAEGAWRAQRERFRAALPERIGRQYPEFVNALFSRKSELRLEAVKALAQTFAPAEKPLFPKLFISPNEARRAIPECVGIVNLAPEFQQVRHLWVSVLLSREEILEEPALAAAARALFEDPSPSVRAFAIWNLVPLVARPADLRELISRWSTLDVNERTRVLDQAGRLRMEETYPFIREQLKDAQEGERAARVVLQHRLDELRPEALSYFNVNPNRLWGNTLEVMTPEEATPILIKKLGLRGWQATDTLREIQSKGTAQAAESVAALLGRKDGEVRRAALSVLARVGTPRQAKAVAAALADQYSKQDEDSAFYDVSGLELLARWGASDEIVELLEYFPKLAPHLDILGEILVRFRPPQAAKGLIPWLVGKDRGNAVQALLWLGRLGATEEVRTHLGVVLSIIAAPELGSARRQAAETAVRLGLREILPLVLENRRSPDFAPLGPLLAEFWPDEERAALLKSQDPGLRQCAVQAALAADGEAALGAVAPLVSDPVGDVRKALAESLATVPGDRAGELLLELARDSDSTVQFLSASGFVRVPRPAWEKSEHRIELLRHPSSYMRLTILQYMDGATLARHPELLETLRHDPSPDVREQIQDPRFTVQAIDWKRLEEKFKKETGTRDLFDLLGTIQGAPPDRQETLLRALFERVLDENAPPVQEQELYLAAASEHLVLKLHRVLEDAAQLAVKSRLTGLEPLFLRMLESRQGALQRAGALAAGGMGIRAAVPRLRELLPGPAGEQAGRALGELHAVPLDLLKEGRPEIRPHLILAAQIAGDASAFEGVLEASRGLSKKEFQDAVKALGLLARPNTARRLLELMDTPFAEDRKAVLEQVRRFPLPELADPVAEYLDDNYYVVGTAASFLRDVGAGRHLAKAAFRAAKHHPIIAARMAGESGLREAIRPLLQYLEVPGNPVLDDTAVEVAEALAELGMREHAPALLAKIRAVPAKTRGRMLPFYARLLGKGALPELLGFLAEPPPPPPPYSYGTELLRPASFGAAEALVDLGITEPAEKIKQVIREDLMTLPAYRLIVRLSSRDLAQEVLERAQKHSQAMEGPLALAARVGLPGARVRLLRLYQESPAATLPWLQTLWGPSRGVTGWDGWENLRYGTARAILSRIEHRTGRPILLKGPIPEGFLDRILQGGMLDELLRALPTPWSFYVDAEGHLVADTVDQVRTAWIAFLSR